MMAPPRLLTVAALAAALTAPLVAQDLRRGLASAEHVCIARQVGIQPLGNELFVHRFETIETLLGNPGATFSMVVRKQVADGPAPADARPGPARLLCLVPDRGAEIPERLRPAWRPTGYRGDQPLVDDSPAWRSLREFVEVMVASRDGAGPARTADRLVPIALRAPGPARLEATQALRESPVLRGELTTVEREGILLAAVGENDDLPVKIALASLAVESGADGAVRALLLSLGECKDPAFCDVLGRLAAHVHGEEADAMLAPFLETARGTMRDRVLHTLGATRTEAALTRLLRMREQLGPSPAIDAALRAHGSRRALQVLEKKNR